MHTDPKQDAQKAEDANLTAQPQVVPHVAKPDAEGIEAAAAAEKKEKAEKEEAAVPRKAPAAHQDRLDLERATGEGMTPPSQPN